MREFHSRHRHGVTETHGNLRWAVESGGCPHAVGFLHDGPIVQRVTDEMQASARRPAAADRQTDIHRSAELSRALPVERGGGEV